MILDDAKQNGVGPNDYRMMAGLLRLAFHDCVGKRCDGCINMRNEDNAGKYKHKQLQSVYFFNKTFGLFQQSASNNGLNAKIRFSCCE